MSIHTCLRFQAFACLLLLAAPALAQDPDRHSLRDGAWALQFSINEDFRLGSFKGSTISAKHHYSDRTALRYGLSLSTQFSSIDQEGGEVGDQDVQDLDLGFNSYYLIHPDLLEQATETVHLYWGFGPDLSFSRDRREVVRGTGDTETTTQTNWRAGVGGVVGAEWFVRPRISLMAEYGSLLGYQRTKNRFEREPLTIDGPTNSGFGLFAEGVRFGVSVYVRAD